jgi:hypothetical protein
MHESAATGSSEEPNVWDRRRRRSRCRARTSRREPNIARSLCETELRHIRRPFALGGFNLRFGIFLVVVVVAGGVAH